MTKRADTLKANAKKKELKSKKQIELAQAIQDFKRNSGVYPSAVQMQIILGIKNRQSLHEIIGRLRRAKVLKVPKRGEKGGSNLLILNK